ncbi:MAG: hypothetical protein WCF67_18255 [Chitinophagaceae bacterium]
MKYHAHVQYNDKSHFWWNCTKEVIIYDVLTPFINGQVVLVTLDGKKVFNMKTANLITIFKTEDYLRAATGNPVQTQICEPSFKSNECTEEIIQEAKLLASSKESSSLLQKSFMEQKDQLFVISKFGDKIIDSAYEGVIKPLCAEFGIAAVRVDEIEDSGKIDDQILNLIAESKFIFADLSGGRPNCYYEAGFAHALGKEIILSIRKNEEVHFDLSGYRFIQWETENELRVQLRKRINSLVNRQKL